jgi:hypothetical protein
MKVTRVLLSTILLVCVGSLIACGGGGGGTPGGQPVVTALTITTSSVPTALEATAYSQQLQASGGTQPYTWSIVTGVLPSGLTLSSSGLISGTSTYNGQKAEFNLQIQVKDATGAFRIAFFQFLAVGKLRVGTTALPDGNANIPYNTGSIFASAGTPPYTFALTGGAVPPGMSFNNGLVTGTPTTPGTFNFTVQITDGDTPPQVASGQVSLTVDNNLAFLTQRLPQGVVTKPYSASVAVVNGTKPYTFSELPGGVLPSGVTLNSTGTLTGTPTLANQYSFGVRVTDSSTPPKSLDAVFVVLIAPQLALQSRTLNDAVQAQGYSEFITPTGGIGPYTSTIISGSLPAGVTTIKQGDGSLLLNGTPSAVGTSTFTIQATDSETPPDLVTATYSIRVNSRLVPQVPSTLAASLVGQPISSQFSATGGVAPYKWSLNPNPIGLVIDPATGLLNGTPTAPFDGFINGGITDSAQPPQFVPIQSFLHVAGLLHVTTSSLPQVVSNSNVNIQLGLIGGTGPFTWSASGLPAGLSISATGAITGNVTGATSPFTVTVNDQGPPAQTVSATLTLPVAAAAGRNDTIATATPLSNGTYFASISPIGDPPGVPASGDVDVYKLTADPGAVVHVETTAARLLPPTPLDTVIEIIDANGARLQTCNTFGPQGAFLSPCMNDDIDTFIGNTDSILFFQAPSNATGPVTFYVKVLDFRGDARPDMVYSITVDGAN